MAFNIDSAAVEFLALAARETVSDSLCVRANWLVGCRAKLNGHAKVYIVGGCSPDSVIRVELNRICLIYFTS